MYFAELEKSDTLIAYEYNQLTNARADGRREDLHGRARVRHLLAYS